MEKVRYMISDAANLVHVESHVLRYWEEELELAIPRNEMGHRYYTRENIQEFQKIKELKEKGYQLKAIRMILHNEGTDMDPVSMQKEEPTYTLQSMEQPSVSQAMHPGVQKVMKPSASERQMNVDKRYGATSPEERMEQFRELMCEIVGHAIALNNEELSQVIGQEVGERVLKEMNYLAREQDEAQEERYKKLDAAIRSSMRKKKPLFEKEKAEKPVKMTRKEKRLAREQEKGAKPAISAS